MTRKKNALTHGANAQEVMLWGETYEDYEALRKRVYEEWCPEGVTEEFEVDRLVDWLWRHGRLVRHEKTSTQKRLDRIRNNNEQSRHIENLKALAAEFNAADTSEKVNALLALLSPLYHNTIQRDWPLREGDDPAKWGATIASGLSAWKVPVRHEGADEFLEAFHPEEAFDRSLGRIERLDAMIDRTIKRLVQIKTMKQLYGQLKPKLISGVTLESAAEKPSKDQPG